MAIQTVTRKQWFLPAIFGAAASLLIGVGIWWFSSPALRTIHAHNHGITCVAFSPDGKFLVSSSHDTTVKVWDLERDAAPFVISRNSGRVESIAFSPDGATLAIATDESETVNFDESGRIVSIGNMRDKPGRAKLIAFPGGEQKASITGHFLSVTRVAFVADGRLLASHGHDQCVKLADVKTGKVERTIEGGIGLGHTKVAFSPDSKRIAMVDRQHLKVLDFDSEQELLTLKGDSDGISVATYSPDSKLIATGEFDHSVRLWDAKNGKLVSQIPLEQPWVEALQFSVDGRILAIGTRVVPGPVPGFLQSNGRLTLWDLESESVIASHSAHSMGVRSIAFAPDGRVLATGGGDGTIRFWRVPVTK